MKKFLFILVFAASAMAASATVQFKSFNNKGNSTTVVFTISEDEKDSTNGRSVDNIVLECDGKTYIAKNIKADFGNTITVYAKFKKLKKFANARIVFAVNGEERSIDIPKD